MANHKRPRPPASYFDYAVFRAEMRARWPSYADAWREAGGNERSIHRFHSGGNETLEAGSYLLLCRAMGVDPMRYLSLEEAT